jgi:hypothetical protein
LLRRQASNDRARKANKLLFSKGEGSISVSGWKLEQRFDESIDIKMWNSYKEAGKFVEFSRMSLKNFGITVIIHELFHF